jgi:hypothetical protein
MRRKRKREGRKKRGRREKKKIMKIVFLHTIYSFLFIPLYPFHFITPGHKFKILRSGTKKFAAFGRLETMHKVSSRDPNPDLDFVLVHTNVVQVH